MTLSDTHTHTHTHTLDRTPPDGGSAHHEDLYLTIRLSQQTAMPTAGFELASKRRQFRALDGAGTGIGCLKRTEIFWS